MPVLDKMMLPRPSEIEQLTLRTVADMIGVSPRTIYDVLMNWPIPRMAASPATPHPHRAARVFPFDEATIRDLYYNRECTIKEIAAELNVRKSLVSDAMDQWRMPRRRRGRRPSKPAAELSH